jgi:hypothetical protein
MPLRIIFAASPDWQRLAARLDSLIEGPEFASIKRNPRTTAGFLHYEHHEIFVKRVRSGSKFKGWLARGFGSRAGRAGRGAQILTDAQFAHPALLLICEVRSGGAVEASYIVTERLNTARILSLLALPKSRDLSLRRAVAQRAAAEIRRLHDAGIYTRDLQETNVMVEERDDAAPIIYFVDLEDVRRVRWVSTRRRMRNLVHLDRSIGRFASRAKRLRFFYNYWGGKPPREVARHLLRQYMRVRTELDRRTRTPQDQPGNSSSKSPADDSSCASQSAMKFKARAN